MKPKQILKYLNIDSTHTQSCFKAIPKGVYQRLAKPTTVTEDNNHKSLKEIYPNHFKALELAKLVPRNIPTLEEEILKREAEQAKPELTAKQAKEKQHKRVALGCLALTCIIVAVSEIDNSNSFSLLSANLLFAPKLFLSSHAAHHKFHRIMMPPPPISFKSRNLVIFLWFGSVKQPSRRKPSTLSAV